MRPTRRRFVATLGAGAVAAGTAGARERDGRDTATDRGGDPPATLQVAANFPHDTFSPMQGYRSTEQFLDLVYDRGLVYHPETGEARPWAFRDWTLSGTTVTAVLTEGLTWSDGTQVTASDVAFTVDQARDTYSSYLVGVDLSDLPPVSTRDDRTVVYEFGEQFGRWREVLHMPILPEHVWADVKPHDYVPTANGGPIGSGAYEVVDFGRRSHLRLTARDPSAYPLIDGLPAHETVEVQFANSARESTELVLHGQAHVATDEVPTEMHPTVTGSSDAEMARSLDGGYATAQYNVRRVPLDDVAFRAALARTFDDRAYLAARGESMADVPADLPISPAYSHLRPFPPDDDQGRRFSFLESSDGQVDVDAVRSLLLNHGGASHEYSFEEAVTDVTSAPDGKELYVDGTPFPDAHTNNDGTGNQGPLTVVVPNELEGKQAVRKWVDDAQRVGIPVTMESVTFNDLIERAFQTEAFDVHTLTWNDPDPGGSHLNALYHSENADVPSSSEAFTLNASGYGGADDILDRMQSTMEVAPHRKAVQAAAVTIYRDCPVFQMGYSQTVQAVDADWDAWTSSPVGVVNLFTVLGGGTVRDSSSPRPTIAVDPSAPVAGESVTLDGSRSSSPNGAITTYEWDVGADGSVDATGETATVTFDSGGERTVRLRVVDESGESATTTKTVTVRPNEAPEPRVSVSPPDPVVGETVTLDASDSRDPDGTIVSYEWDVGADGSVDAEGETTTVTFEAAGERTVSLRVVDDAGVASTVAVTVRVATPTPSPSPTDANEDTDGANDDSAESTPGFGVVTGAVGALGAAAAMARRRFGEN